MQYEARWTEYAYHDFERIGEWLLCKWGLNSVSKFKREIDFILSLLNRKTLVNKHTTLYFRIDGTIVTLIAFWNHAQDPGELEDFINR